MTQVIETVEELHALDKGTELRDRDGFYVLKYRDGDYVVIAPNNGESFTCSAEEINGDYTGEGSRFYPLTVIGHCWYCDRETSRTMYGKSGEDWSCMDLHDEPLY